MTNNFPFPAFNKKVTRGFSLIELVVVLVIIGALAAIVMPRYIEMRRDVRLAVLNNMSGTIWTAAVNARSLCAASPGCDIGNPGGTFLLDGRNVGLNLGWPEAGDNLNGNQIDTWINYSGFTASLPDAYHTKFSLDGSPDPANCAVVYQQSVLGYPPTVTLLTTGCQ